MRISVLPRDDSGCGWFNILPTPTPARRLSGVQKADWLVVGAGFAGLAAARRLAERQPNARILLIEAQRVGYGASGRNSGFVIDLPHSVDLSKNENIEDGLRLLRIQREGIRWLKELVDRHGIACNWEMRGKYQAAVTELGRKALDEFVAGLAKLGESYERFERAELEKRFATRRYVDAIWTPGTALMQPAALVRGLAASLPANVELYEESPVTDVHYGPPHRLTTATGSVEAPQLILATNGFTAEWGVYAKSLVRVLTFASLTEPLSADRLAALGSERDWGLTPGHHGGATLRRTIDNRLLVRSAYRFGGNPTMGAAEAAKLRQLHRRVMTLRWPALADLDFAHSWGGVMCYSKNFAPGWGRVGHGIYAAVCQNGVGVSKGSMSGRLVADYALGEENEFVRDMAAFASPKPHGLGPLIGPAVNAKIFYTFQRGWRER